METKTATLRELDALAAEHVLGWTPHPTLSHEWWRLPETKATNIRILGTEDGPWDRITPPHFTTDIADAWQLVEKMMQRHTQDFHFGYQMCDGAKWHFGFQDKVMGFFGNCSATADTAPLAITLAALKAVGIDPPPQPERGAKEG